MARANAERFIKAAATAVSATEMADPTLCPRCRRPLMDPFGLGLCSACGYCHSLQAGRTQLQISTDPNQVVAKPTALGGLGAIYQRLPEGVMLPLGGAAGVLVVSLLFSMSLQAGDPLRVNGGVLEMLAGLLSILGAHHFARKLCLPAAPPEGVEAKPAPATPLPSFFAFKEIWRGVIQDMPATRLHMAGGTCGLALFFGGLFLMVPGLTAAQENNQVVSKLEAAEVKSKAKRDEEKQQKSRAATGERLNQLRQQPGKAGTQPRTGTSNPKPVEPGSATGSKPAAAADPRPTLPCVVIGYTTNSSKQLTGLVLGTVSEGQVVFAGVVDNLDVDQRVQLEVKLSGLKRSDPLVEVPGVEAAWVRPSVFCEVHHSGVAPSGRLDSPRFGSLLED